MLLQQTRLSLLRHILQCVMHMSTLSSTSLQSNAIQYNCSAMKSSFMVPVMSSFCHSLEGSSALSNHNHAQQIYCLQFVHPGTACRRMCDCDGQHDVIETVWVKCYHGIPRKSVILKIPLYLWIITRSVDV